METKDLEKELKRNFKDYYVCAKLNLTGEQSTKGVVEKYYDEAEAFYDMFTRDGTILICVDLDEKYKAFAALQRLKLALAVAPDVVFNTFKNFKP